MDTAAYVAFDIGAESGRAMLSIVSGGKLELVECHRFANRPQVTPSGMHWALMDLWSHLQEGLRHAAVAAHERGLKIKALGVDTWAVDFGLLGKSGQLLGLPFAYRDERNPPAMQRAFDKLGAERVYMDSGIQLLPFNTVFQLLAQQAQEPAVLEHADRLLLIPDLLHYFFTGVSTIESTNASTTGMVDPFTNQWHQGLLNDLELPTHMLGQIVDAGSVVGPVLPGVLKQAGIDYPVDVITPGTHDTASAIAAVPVQEDVNDWAYLSSGTWSLLGAELDQPLVSNETYRCKFTNERGVANKIRFLKNIAGLWLVQQTRADLNRDGSDYDYATLTQLASEAEPFRTLIDTTHAPFAAPGDFRQKIAAFAEKTGQPVPETPGQFVRCCLESLALTYRSTLQELDGLLGRRSSVLHIVGGGGQSRLLNQMTADAVQRPVIVGPFEATAIGNALTQAMGAGQINGLAGIRQVVRDSFPLQTFEPGPAAAWDAAAERFSALAGGE